MQVLVHGVVAAALALESLGGALAAEPRFRVQDLNALTGLSGMSPLGFNNRGDFTLVDEQGGHGYLWRDGRLQDLGVYGVGGMALNERGDVAGTRVLADGSRQPFLWRDGRFIDLAASLGARSGIAYAINESGHVVGTADDRAFMFDGSRSRWLDIPGATSSEAFDINDRGTIAGGAKLAGDTLTERGYLLHNGKVMPMPTPDRLTSEWGGAFDTRALNNAGSAAIRYHDYNEGELGGSLYVNGRYTDLGYLHFAFDINEHDWAVGNSLGEDADGNFTTAGRLYRDGQSYRLDALLTASAAAQWQRLDSANFINDRGQIVGTGTLADGHIHAFIATPVPEAPGLALMLAGLGGLGVALRGLKCRERRVV
jgi:uncharacterized membrane protein